MLLELKQTIEDEIKRRGLITEADDLQLTKHFNDFYEGICEIDNLFSKLSNAVDNAASDIENIRTGTGKNCKIVKRQAPARRKEAENEKIMQKTPSIGGRQRYSI